MVDAVAMTISSGDCDNDEESASDGASMRGTAACGIESVVSKYAGSVSVSAENVPSGCAPAYGALKAESVTTVDSVAADAAHEVARVVVVAVSAHASADVRRRSPDTHDETRAS